MQKFTYQTVGTCSRLIEFYIDGDVVKQVDFVGGCPGNAIGLANLIQGQQIDDLIIKLKGVQCQNGTSCPDQFARALEAAKNKNVSA